MAKFTDKIKKPSGKSKNVLYIAGAVIGVIVIYLYVTSGSSPTRNNQSSVAPIDGNVTATPGGKYSAEYTRALQQNNKMLAQQAQMEGGSSVATMINTSGSETVPAAKKPCCKCQKPTLKSMVGNLLSSGKISKATANELNDLAKKNLSVGDYADQLERLVKEGKLTPEQARALLEQYKQEHGDQLAAQSAKAMDADIQSGKLPLDAANDLLDLQKNGASANGYANELARLVKAGKISPALAKQLLAEYEKKHGTLANVNLDQLVATGIPAGFASKPAATKLPGFNANSGLHPVMADSQTASSMTAEEAAAAQAQAQQIQALSASMKTQAGNIIKGNGVSVQQAVVATPPKPVASGSASDSAAAKDHSSSSDNAAAKAPFVKAGEIEFAVLDTAVNSDYPGSPIMATIVQGKLKGGKLLGKLSTSRHGADRVVLNFTLLNMPNWAKPISINAVAIDPETARSALATSVNYHILSRYGALFASAFLQGYADTFTQAGTIIVTQTGNEVQTNPPLSPKQRVFAGVGKFGDATSTAAENYFNTPPTVKVKSGVGLGILFMENVASPNGSGASSNKTEKNGK